MKYSLKKYGDDSYDIGNDDAYSLVARVDAPRPGARGPEYRVRIWITDPGDDDSPEFVVRSIDELIPAVAAYYEAHPPRWVPESDCTPHYRDMGPCRARYMKDTQFGDLWVDQIEKGQWVAYRDGHGLSSDGGEIEKFATCEEAQRAADAHFRDGYPNSKIIEDGLSWPVSVELQWWLDPHCLASRGRLAVT